MLTIQDLIDNGTVAPAGGDALRGIGAGVESFLVYSLPRNAGKSTVAAAIVAEAPAGTVLHDFLGTEAEVAQLTAVPASGYLVVAEMGHRGQPGYLAQEEIVRAFELIGHGYALASSLHADTVEQLFDVLAQNGINAAAAVAVRHLVKVQPLGDPFDAATRRVVEHIHEVVGIGPDDVPTTRLVFPGS